MKIILQDRIIDDFAIQEVSTYKIFKNEYDLGFSVKLYNQEDLIYFIVFTSHDKTLIKDLFKEKFDNLPKFFTEDKIEMLKDKIKRVKELHSQLLNFLSNNQSDIPKFQI